MRLRVCLMMSLAMALAGPASAVAKDVHLRGTAYEFNEVETRLGGAAVKVAERPGLETVVKADGSYDLKVPDKAQVTPYIQAAGYHTIYLQTFTTAGADLRDVNFQVPTDAVYGALVALLSVPTDADGDPAACAIVSTFSTRNVRGVSFAGFIAYGAHGVAGATATASPALPAPVYFDQNVLPDPMQQLSSADGGVIWTGVPPGTYTIGAQHPGTRFSEFTATCVPGRVVNANPPWGLHELGLTNRAQVAARWTAASRLTRLQRLTASDLPENASVRVSCTGARCPVRTRTLTPTTGTKTLNVRVSMKAKEQRLRPGQALELRITAPAYDGVVARWVARPRRPPKRSRLCIPLGNTRARQSDCGS